MKVYIYTDGGCRDNQKETNVGAWAYTMTYMGETKEDYGFECETTNNRQEMKAVINALSVIATTHIPLVLHTDSAYVLNGATDWIHGWKKNSWKTAKKKPVINKDLWLEIDALMNKFDSLEWVKVKGHSDNEGNNRADELVNKAMDEYEEELG